MTRDLVIGLDCSTTAAKAVAWDPAGQAVAEGRSAFDVARPHPGWGEQDPHDWWRASSQAIAACVAGVDPARVAALSITHQRETFVCLDEAGQPLRPAMLWLDVRATEQVARHGDRRVHERTGKPPNPTPAWYKLHWIAEHEPEVLARTARVVDVAGYLLTRLTGRCATSWASADPLGVLNLATFDYDDELLAEVGLTRAQMPELLAPGEVLGGLVGPVAAEFGLDPDTPVVAAGGDGQCAGLGTGVTSGGRAYLNLGSGIVSGTHSPQYSFSHAYRTMTSVLAGAYVLETFMGGGTLNVAWFVEQVGPGPVDGSAQVTGAVAGGQRGDLRPEQRLEQAAATVRPGADGLLCLPYWTGALTPYWDSAARGVFLGLTGTHTRAHLYRALLEGIAYEQRLHLEGSEAALAEPITELTVLGGGSASALWCQIIADVIGLPVAVAAEGEATSLGAGMLGAAAVGLHADVPAAAAAMHAIARRYDPDPATAARYRAAYAVYREVYPSLRGLFPDLAALAGP